MNHAHLFPLDDSDHPDDSANESSPEHETSAAPERAHVVGQDRVVDLGAEETANNRAEDHVAGGGWVFTPVLQLPLKDDLPYHEAEKHREAKAGELQRPKLVRNRMMNYLRENMRHSKDQKGGTGYPFMRRLNQVVTDLQTH